MKRQLVSGMKGLRKLLQSDRGRFAAAPILLIESAGDKAVEEACKHVHFTLAQQLGFRTVVSNSLGESAFPTVQLVEQQKELAARVGAGIVCAVGSEAAIHLGKALSQGMDELVLFPTTYPAVMASTMERSLLIDTKEETIVPDTSSWKNAGASFDSITLALPDKSFIGLPTESSARESAFAVLTFCMAREYQGASFNDEIITNLESFLSLVEEQPKDALEPLLTSLSLAGEDMKWGFGRERRDVPLAIAVSLLPKIFPNSNTVAAMASLASTLAQDNESTELVDLFNRLVGAFGEPSALVCNQSVDTLMGVVRDNQAAWNCLDARKEALTYCLSAHSLVD
eukprot:scaffold521_cov167-Amphora_coffeaeformis.AAC.10